MCKIKIRDVKLVEIRLNVENGGELNGLGFFWDEGVKCPQAQALIFGDFEIICPTKQNL